MNRWINKVAVVTGASAGIGAAISQELVEAGVNVVGLARNKERLDTWSKKLEGSKGKFYGVVCDIGKEEDILKAFTWTRENLGAVYILVNNAGIYIDTSLLEGKTEAWRKVFDTNVIGLCIATREAVKDMKLNHVDGHIVHINSLSGHCASNTNVYGASKYAVTALTETLRQELQSLQSKIKVTSISPGFVESEMMDREALYDAFKNNANACRKLKPKDVADAVVYTLSTPPHVQVHEIMMRHI